MSNSSPSPVSFTFRSGPILLFVGLMLALGALMMASNGIDPRSAQRAQFATAVTINPAALATKAPPTVGPTPTPVDAFANLDYEVWSSPDGFISFERPKLWQPVSLVTERGPFGFGFVVPGSTDTGIIIEANPVITYSSLAGTSSTATAFGLMRAFAPNVSRDDIQDATLNGNEAATFKTTTPGTASDVEAHLWLAKLDSANVIFVQIQAPTASVSKLQPVIDRFLKSLKLNISGITGVLAKVTPAAAPAK